MNEPTDSPIAAITTAGEVSCFERLSNADSGFGAFRRTHRRACLLISFAHCTVPYRVPTRYSINNLFTFTGVTGRFIVDVPVFGAVAILSTTSIPSVTRPKMV